MIARSIFDYSWIDEIIAKDPVLIIAEGLLMYFMRMRLK
jgi:O-methyltransferase involved in polyketide biosynthesis